MIPSAELLVPHLACGPAQKMQVGQHQLRHFCLCPIYKECFQGGSFLESGLSFFSSSLSLLLSFFSFLPS